MKKDRESATRNAAEADKAKNNKLLSDLKVN